MRQIPFSSYPRIHCNKPVRRLIPRAKQPCRRHRRLPICARFPMPTVMQHNIGRAPCQRNSLNLFNQALGDPFRSRLFPVRCHRVPHDRNHAQLPRNAQRRGSPSTEWRPKIFHPHAGNLFQQITCAAQLFTNPFLAGQRQVWMAPRVIANQVSGANYPPHQFRFGLCITSQQKKCSAHLVLHKNVQQPRRPLSIRPIVKCQGNFLRSAWRNQRLAEDLRARPLCSIGVTASQQTHAGR